RESESAHTNQRSWVRASAHSFGRLRLLRLRCKCPRRPPRAHGAGRDSPICFGRHAHARAGAREQRKTVHDSVVTTEVLFESHFSASIEGLPRIICSL